MKNAVLPVLLATAMAAGCRSSHSMANGTGGVPGSGGAIITTAPIPGTGGLGGSGGVLGTGGLPSTGGLVGTGGVLGSGGLPSTGGLVGSGGVPGTGGTIITTIPILGTGGVPSTGGVPGTVGTIITTVPIPGTGGVPGSGGTGGRVGSGGTVACVGDTSVVGSLGLQATPAVIAPGQSSTLTWYAHSATTLTIDQGIGSVLGKTSQAVTPAQTTTYTLTLTGAATIQDKVTVIVTEKAFRRTGSLSSPRSSHTATLLPNGKVLIVGGSSNGQALASAELYDPTTGSFSSAGAMTAARSNLTASLLVSGKVLIVGGSSGTGAASAELYDPASNTFVATGNPAVGRESHTATSLASGKVLIAGGLSGQNGLTSAELYDPTAGSFSMTGNLTAARYQHSATLLADGRVLLVGGNVKSTDTGNHDGLDSAELYDPTTGTFAATGSCGQRVAPEAALLSEGTVLVGGGWHGFEGYFNSSSLDLYDPASGQSSRTGPLAVSRALFSMTLLADGSVLMTGGLQHNGGSEDGYLVNAEIYGPTARTSTLTACMTEARYSHTATLLSDGRVLITGGRRSGADLAGAELYQ